MIRCGVLTVSDRSARGQRPDLSGPALVAVLTSQGWDAALTAVVPDEQAAIQSTLVEWCDARQPHLIVTTGGTGFAPRDVTPEATRAVIEREAPGLAEAMRAESLKTTPHAMLSRAIAGIRGRTLIINLPGSPTAAVENLQAILPVLPHAFDLLWDEPQSEAGHSKI